MQQQYSNLKNATMNKHGRQEPETKGLTHLPLVQHICISELGQH